MITTIEADLFDRDGDMALPIRFTVTHAPDSDPIAVAQTWLARRTRCESIGWRVTDDTTDPGYFSHGIHAVTE